LHFSDRQIAAYAAAAAMGVMPTEVVEEVLHGDGEGLVVTVDGVQCAGLRPRRGLRMPTRIGAMT
jgi:hypothetical protein